MVSGSGSGIAIILSGRVAPILAIAIYCSLALLKTTTKFTNFKVKYLMIEISDFNNNYRFNVID